MKRIIFMNQDGGVSVITPVDNSLTVEEIAQRDIPYSTEYKIIDSTEIPTDFTFRDAWSDLSFNVNMQKAKEITKAKLRLERQPKLEQLDVDYMKALENNEDTSSIVTEKQRLRDITTLADNANTLDELKNLKV